MKLSEPLINYIRWKGYKLKLNLSFDTILTIYEVWQDRGLLDTDKLTLTMDMLIKNRRVLKRIPLTEQNKLLIYIFKTFINTGNKAQQKKAEPTYDFIQDASFIFASFFMDYGIDLIKAQGRLDWRKFIALFSGLSDNTQMREIMSIRARPLPKPTKYNAEEIRALKEAKQYYALNFSFSEREENLQSGLDNLFASLKARAQK